MLRDEEELRAFYRRVGLRPETIEIVISRRRKLRTTVPETKTTDRELPEPIPANNSPRMAARID